MSTPLFLNAGSVVGIMRVFVRFLVVGLVAGNALPLPEDACENSISVNVAVVGGGASGAYAAVRLKEDFNQTIVLIEKQEKLVRHPDAAGPHCHC